MRKPIVSVLIPVYNVEQYLGKCLDSVIAQTLTNIEIICVNDGSEDNSLEILKEYQKKDSRIRIVNKENGGLPSARNAGLDAAKGIYVGFVDSDDYIEPTMFQKLVKTAEKKHSEIVICGSVIFPEKPKASKWLYDCLSPQRRHYERFEPELFAQRQDTHPFLWRTLIKKDLLDRNSFRLDEDIIVGEDQAFQAKVYPKAKGISVIPDKLYHYLWCRPGSLMGKQVYGNLEKRLQNHTRLTERIGQDIQRQNGEESIRREYLSWAIPFLYADFIYGKEKDRADAAEALIPLWKDMGYYGFQNEMEEWKSEQFHFIESFLGKGAEHPELSVIIPIEYKSRYVEQMIVRIKKSMRKNVEFIIVNNGMSNENYIKVQKWLCDEPKIRLYNTPEHFSYAEALNSGIGLAGGNYLAFLDTQDWYVSADRLEEWLSCAMQKKTDLCVCPCVKMCSDSDSWQMTMAAEKAGKAYDADYHNFLYRKAFLVEHEMVFQENSLLTGFVFMCKALAAAGSVSAYEKEVYVLREMHTADWISTEKCEQLLKGLEKLMELSVKNQDSTLHGKVMSVLNSDRIKQLIVNNTKPYVMPPAQCPNGENSQIETVGTLFCILGMADEKMLYEYGMNDEQSIADTLYEVIAERQRFLGRLSEEG